MDYQAILEILKRRKRLIGTMAAIGVALALAILVLMPRQYTAKSQVLLIGMNSVSDPITTNIDLQTLAVSTNVMSAVQRDLRSTESIDDLKSRVTPVVNFGSDVMVISYDDPNRETAIAGANAVASGLANYYRQIASNRAAAVSSFLQSQLDRKREELDRLDQRLQLAIVRDPYFADGEPAAGTTGNDPNVRGDSGDAVSTLGEQIVALEQNRQEIDATLVGERAQAAAVASHMAEVGAIIRSEELGADPVYVAQRGREASDAAQLALMRSQYNADYPGLPGMQAQVAAEKAQLLQTERQVLSEHPASPTYVSVETAKGDIDAKIAADDARLRAVDSQIQDAEAHVNSLRSGGAQVLDLRRQRDLVAREFQELSDKLVDTSTAVAQEGGVGSIEVVDQARTAPPTIGKRELLAIVGTFLGFILLGVGLAFALESLDPRLRTIAAVEGLYGRPVLGSVH